MWAIIGLGNPGRFYLRTRHNVGYSFIKRVAEERGVKLKRRKLRARVAEIKRGGEDLVLVQPTTYMNQSGLAVRDILEKYRVRSEQMLIVYDDLDIPLGQIRVRKEGSAGSHKGMRSVIEELGTQVFPRIRIGVGPLADRAKAVRFVLSPFAAEEWPKLEEGLNKAREALNLILEGRIEQAMSMFNQRETVQRRQEKSPPL